MTSKAHTVSRERLEEIRNYGTSRIITPISDAEIMALVEITLTAMDSEPVVTDAMALAFHQAITDGSAGSDDIDEIKTGLRAALANYAAAPEQEV